MDRMTVNLTPRTSAALQRIVDRNGDNKTDTINRAIQLLALCEDLWADGGTVFIQATPSGRVEVLRVL